MADLMRRAAVVLAAAGALAAGMAVAVLPLASAAAASGWSIQHTPNPAGGSDSILNGVSCTSASACSAVGDYFNGTAMVALAERWNGTRWSIRHPPNPAGASDVFLHGVSCTSASACTAVGNYFSGTASVALAERWNGTRWSIQHTPNPAGSSNTFLTGVSCTSASACTAVGDSGNGTTTVTLAERWNGTRWSIRHPPNPAAAPGSILLNAVSCASASACTAVGTYSNGTMNVTLAERWNGTRWSIQHTATPAGSQASTLAGVSCTSATACTAVGNYFNGTTRVALAERWNGTRWSIRHPPNPAGGSDIHLLRVSCTSATACTAVGNSSNGTTRVTLAERWNGTRWSIQHTPNPAGGSNSTLDGVSCASATACTAVGGSFDGTPGVTLAERWNG
jgi:hypothetical protein